jgi:peptide-methionine (S)-S-oxide reductase
MNDTKRNAKIFAAVGFAILFSALPLRAGIGSAAAAAAKPATHALSKAVFAGGCFWCEEATFEGFTGIKSVVSGFSGGTQENPTYEQVSAGHTGHAESVEITFDPAIITYQKLLNIYWHNIDPTQANAQFCDHGDQYRSAIFYANEVQRRAALASMKAIEASKALKAPIVTQIVPLTKFWPAEEYHQDYYKKNPADYHAYRLGCGRDARLREVWGAAAGAHSPGFH